MRKLGSLATQAEHVEVGGVNPSLATRCGSLMSRWPSGSPAYGFGHRKGKRSDAPKAGKPTHQRLAIGPFRQA